MARPPKHTETTASDNADLDPADVEAILAEAREKVEAERKDKARKRILADALKKERVKQGLIHENTAQPDQKITIDLAEYSGFISLDGRPYHHGHTYTVSYGTAQTLRERMARSHAHQAEIDGKSRFEAQQRAKRLGLSPNGMRQVA